MVVAVTMGDPTGIGPEICVKALQNSKLHAFVIGSAALLGPRVNKIKKVSEAKFVRGVINVMDISNPRWSPGRASMEYLEKAVELALKKEISAIATAPISKAAINKAGYRFAGHTEFFAKRTRTKNYAMMFVADPFWVVLATTHIPLNQVSKKITKERILNVIKLAHRARKSARIAVAGLNPHAGEKGLLGDEEKRKIIPAIAAARKLGISVEGPFPADTLFNAAKNGKYDLVVAMYHDQGLIPIKLLAFNKAVNVTIGLPIIRTSVDHGTGFDIAGKNMADPSSLIRAIKVAECLCIK
ncbi:4-hydroxythreonine-4-phosphate dehydrogenase PdxA [candidate division WOR-1 bacterium RIFOXYA12_FULL_43_27]|uniref:4-hydroxythreonine-4-phosphate dehydrogenase PdxA n=1 Tax=candidate division WOR-1 bacterium RIFOXYC2_FULL_46_14 TaxID=1802587 RepID=A0A1F4U6S7_UNCSA|nr:MAG: 4-hydroxythreonine-4-phosphate dehydrogenase PdxA [candidate division WOR-1 bacterium RIFOXYA12_FULL_43_27]OGC19556.1 MAG: 4-hydroxythreonine-4-phosphate dehydrogenase PdxA [candidate division WOR-1 bacterium RIFOXYB2_FULL_46_45]OGC30544.1 MAG: 4-hydroxythreonine-4-phosphate dehydrogenase PdxA [candidate division WOR-1 bacterium RIFOXYA2_FULL_46_56]OGC40611.1 MAG: 4-hydroxythreonine-4-phosphate dehydrogenase PdxA [candidate division WOR-1 bacterium RIFOXYC2_FULL_46_14]